MKDPAVGRELEVLVSVLGKAAEHCFNSNKVYSEVVSRFGSYRTTHLLTEYFLY